MAGRRNFELGENTVVVYRCSKYGFAEAGRKSWFYKVSGCINPFIVKEKRSIK